MEPRVRRASQGRSCSDMEEEEMETATDLERSFEALCRRQSSLRTRIAREQNAARQEMLQKQLESVVSSAADLEAQLWQRGESADIVSESGDRAASKQWLRSEERRTERRLQVALLVEQHRPRDGEYVRDQPKLRAETDDIS